MADDDLDGIDFVQREEVDRRDKTRLARKRRGKVSVTTVDPPGPDDEIMRPGVDGIPPNPFGEGVEIPQQRRRGRPRLTEEEKAARAAQKTADKAEEDEDGDGDEGSFGPRIEQGVTVNWLANAFGVSRETVRKRISQLRPVGFSKKSNLYDFRESAELIVTPKIDLVQAIRRLNHTDIPSWISHQFWQAQNFKLKYAQDSNQLWHSSQVVASFAAILKPVREGLMGLEEALAKARMDGKSEADVIREIMRRLEDGMRTAASDDPLVSYREMMHNEEIAMSEKGCIAEDDVGLDGRTEAGRA